MSQSWQTQTHIFYIGHNSLFFLLADFVFIPVQHFFA